ncbi:MAG: glycosyltransferase family 2 protein [Bdellovibrio sp.]
MSNKTVDVIIPCYNEHRFIGTMLDSVISQDYPAHLVKIYVADGMSEDGTREVLKSYQQKYSNIFIIDNPHKVTPYALNSALKASNSEVVVRMDCHAYYPSNYISYLVEKLFSTGADNVGVCLETMPASESDKSYGIALAISIPIGVGNSMFRTGVSAARDADTVPFGCYRREVFTRIGLFDEELVRGQDGDLNSRLLNAGGRIVLLPENKVKYFARDTFLKLSKMYYQYGLYKPFTNYKAKRIMSWRQFVPTSFLFTILSLVIVGVVVPKLWVLPIAFFAMYEIAVGFFIVRSSSKITRFNSGVFASALWSVNLLHFSYGWGFLKGFVLLLAKRRPGNVRINR